MKKTTLVAGVLAASATVAQAGGIDRSGQGIGILFEKGRYAELSLGSINPSVSGTDRTPAIPGILPGPQSVGSVADRYTQIGLGYKYDINEKVSFALVIDQPFGVDVLYGPSSPFLGGTSAFAKSTAITGLLRYKFNDAFSVHGGIKAQRSSAFIRLQGLAYGGLSGYNVALGNDTAPGYVVGAAFEKPEIALRVALTYHSEVKHEFASVENGLPGPLAALNGVPGTTNVNTPQSVNLDFQTGVAKNTLVFGQIRWVDWSNLKLSPFGFDAATVTSAGTSLINLEDTTTYTLGVGRKFNDTWAGSISFSYEDKGNTNVSPLAPTAGRVGVTVAGVYTKGNMKVTAGVNYTKLGDATAVTAVPAADMTDNTSLGVGIKVGFSF